MGAAQEPSHLVLHTAIVRLETRMDAHDRAFIAASASRSESFKRIYDKLDAINTRMLAAAIGVLLIVLGATGYLVAFNFERMNDSQTRSTSDDSH